MKCLPYGDRAILVNFSQEISTEVNSRVVNLQQALAQTPGITFQIPAYCSLTVGFDPDMVTYESLVTTIGKYADKATKPMSGRLLSIPVCYDESLAPDLQRIPETLNLSKKDLVQLHTSEVYDVYMVGFIPGFAYMGKTKAPLHCKRKDTPRRIVPARSVGLAGAQTGIYPFDSPGGWQLIGKTPINTFETDEEDPFLFKSGDRVKFYSISVNEYDKLETSVNQGTFKRESIYERS